MYLMATHIPIYTDGVHHEVDVSWQRDLLLTRDWLAGPYGGLTVIAPSLPLQSNDGQTMARVAVGRDDGIRVVPSIDARGGARNFWLRDRHVWHADVSRELAGARIFHTAACDVFRPVTFMAHAAAVRAGVPSVFVGPDMDVHVTLPDTLPGRLQRAIFDRWTRRALRTARLGLLKEGLVYDRYQRFGSNVKAVCHSMHRETDVIAGDRLEQRLQAMDSGRPLRAVYAGRFVRRKGLHDSISAIADATRAGAAVELHLFGSGPEEDALRRQATALGVADRVVFHGVVEYSPAFIRTLAEFDLFLFMPIEEDTPRALFDTMAAGLPLLGTRIPFLRTRVENDRLGVLVEIRDSSGAASQLRTLQTDVDRLRALSRNARNAGLRHSVDRWYRLRAEWTQAACPVAPTGPCREVDSADWTSA